MFTNYLNLYHLCTHTYIHYTKMDLPTLFQFTASANCGTISLGSSKDNCWKLFTKWTTTGYLTCVELNRLDGTGKILVEVTLEQLRDEKGALIWQKNIYAHIEDEQATLNLFSPLLVPFQKSDVLKGRVAIFDFKKKTICNENTEIGNSQNKIVSPFKENIRHLFNFSRDLLHLLDHSGSFSDAVLKCGQVEIPVHKCILSARSPVFAAMFQNQMKESKSGIVDIVDMEIDALKVMLRYFYGGKIDDLSDSMAEDLLFVCDKYGLESLKPICTDKLKSILSRDNVFHFLVLGDLHDANLKAHAKKFICSFKQFSDLEKTDGWKSLKTGYPKLEAEVLLTIVKHLQSPSYKRDHLVNSSSFKINVQYMEISYIRRKSFTNGFMHERCERGKFIGLEVAESDTIEDIKEKILAKEDIPKQQQILTLNRKELVDGRTLSYYDVQKNSTLKLVRKCIYILNLTGKTIVVDYEPSYTTEKVKLMLQIREGIPCKEIRLIYDGKQLEDGRTLNCYNIQNNSLLYWVLRLCGGGETQD